MDFGIEKFSEAAKKLSHNPLGIIALFIWLVYAIAALVMMCSINSLYPHESFMLLLFIIFFPLVILLVFYRLVTRHHTKLYAPKDYRTDDSFHKSSPASIEDQKEQIDLEIKEEHQELEQGEKESKPKQNLIQTIESVREKYLLVENLTFRALEAELKEPIKKACWLGFKKDSPIVDGIFFRNGHLNIVEIKMITAPRFALITIGKFLSKLNVYYLNQKEKGVYHEKARVLLAVVVNGSTDLRSLKFRVKRVVDKHPDINVDIRMFDFKELKQKFGIE